MDHSIPFQASQDERVGNRGRQLKKCQAKSKTLPSTKPTAHCDEQCGVPEKGNLLFFWCDVVNVVSIYGAPNCHEGKRCPARETLSASKD